MIQIIISALVLCATLYLIARHEAEISLPVILMITVGVSVAAALLLIVHPLAPLLSLVLLAWAIQRFCYLSWNKAWIATAIYLVVNIALSFGLRALRGA